MLPREQIAEKIREMRTFNEYREFHRQVEGGILTYQCTDEEFCNKREELIKSELAEYDRRDKLRTVMCRYFDVPTEEEYRLQLLAQQTENTTRTRRYALFATAAAVVSALCALSSYLSNKELLNRRRD